MNKIKTYLFRGAFASLFVMLVFFRFASEMEKKSSRTVAEEPPAQTAAQHMSQDQELTRNKIQTVLDIYDELLGATGELEALKYLSGICDGIGASTDLGRDWQQQVAFENEYCYCIDNRVKILRLQAQLQALEEQE